MNVLVLGGRVIGPELAQELVKAYLGATLRAKNATAGGWKRSPSWKDVCERCRVCGSRSGWITSGAAS